MYLSAPNLPSFMLHWTQRKVKAWNMPVIRYHVVMKGGVFLSQSSDVEFNIVLGSVCCSISSGELRGATHVCGKP